MSFGSFINVVGLLILWSQRAASFLLNKLPLCNAYWEIHGGDAPGGTIGANDGNLNGGSYQPSNGSWGQLSRTLYQLPLTGIGGWGIQWRGKVSVPVSTQKAYAGIVSVDRNKFVVIGTDFAVSPTNFVMEVVDNAGPGSDPLVLALAADTAEHDFALVFDPITTKLTAYVDNVAVGNLTPTQLTDTPMAAGIFNTGGTAKLSRYGYVWKE